MYETWLTLQLTLELPLGSRVNYIITHEKLYWGILPNSLTIDGGAPVEGES